MEVLFLLAAYLIGSLSAAIIVCKICRFPDPRTQGSKNPGATNVLRFAGKKTAAIVLLLDGVKGFIPVIIAHEFNFSILMQGFTVFAVVLGHVFPIFFRFQGGKGVATFFGAMLGFVWPIGVVLLFIWVIIAKVFHYSSLAALVTAICAPLITFFFYQPYVVTPIILTSLLIIYRHKDNMVRIANKTESKIGDHKRKKA